MATRPCHPPAQQCQLLRPPVARGGRRAFSAALGGWFHLAGASSRGALKAEWSVRREGSGEGWSRRLRKRSKELGREKRPNGRRLEPRRVPDYSLTTERGPTADLMRRSPGPDDHGL